MDGYCRAQGRAGTPASGNPPLLYTLLRYRNNLRYVCALAEQRAIPSAYPPPIELNIHIRAQLSSPLTTLESGRAGSRHEARRACDILGTPDVFIETKYDGFRFQVHCHCHSFCHVSLLSLLRVTGRARPQ